MYPKMDPLLSSLMHQALFKYETPRLELKSLQTFWTKSQKIIMQLRSSLKGGPYVHY